MLYEAETKQQSSGEILAQLPAPPERYAVELFEGTLAGATPYLKLTGVVAGGWQMALAARIARDLTQAGATDDAFLRGKIATSRFYAEHVLPEAEAWRLEVTSGAASTLALADTSF